VILTRHGRVRLPDRIREIMHNLRRSADARDAKRLAGYRGYAAMVSRRPKLRRKRKKRTDVEVVERPAYHSNGERAGKVLRPPQEDFDNDESMPF